MSPRAVVAEGALPYGDRRARPQVFTVTGTKFDYPDGFTAVIEVRSDVVHAAERPVWFLKGHDINFARWYIKRERWEIK